ncbi:NAD(P)-dependent oxidoreductase [Mitsuokella multacida]|uniref:4-phosphoerythronate dehydrogenase n=1 Tax=Mitsuokella multacida DSM 20544 TaxID=500635 RepID=C9KIX3_9FIRM|nr:NAD(P)-dependent oxidoreductase [Mitsuokella multacida]EEX70235.1 4-phosphoerythronate dehydrogenase [Mitsuokella multacida DSM 20544]
MIPNVYLHDHICDSAVARLRRHVNLVDNFDHPEELDAIIVRQQYCPREVISRAKRCRLIQMHGVGLDRIDVEAAKEYGISVKRTKGGNAQSVAELAIGFMLAMARKMKFLDRGLQAGKFQTFGLPETVGLELSGKKLGLVGGGQIAQLVADIARAAFHCKLFVYDPFLSAEACKKLGFQKVETVEALVAAVDFVSIHVPLTESTKHMFNAAVFAKANPDLILVNTSRGGVVDEEALYQALTTGQILAAGMDVFEQQPPRPDHPLLSLDNFIGTLHVGGSTREALERNGNTVVDNVFAALHIKEEE